MKYLSFKNKICKEKLKRFFLTFFAIVVVYMLLFLLQKVWLNKYPEFTLLKQYRSNQLNTLISNNGLLFIILMPSIIVPLLEELMFRSWLILSPKNIALLIGSLPYMIIEKLFSEMNWGIFILSSLITGIVLYKISFIILSKFNFKPRTDNNFIIIAVILSSVLFGFMHVFNFPEINIYSIILILPQIVAGFGFAYIRIKNGLAWSILLHSLNNLPITLAYLSIVLN